MNRTCGTDAFGNHFGSEPEYDSWAAAMQAEIKSVKNGAKGWEDDWEREDAKGKRKTLRLGRK